MQAAARATGRKAPNQPVEDGTMTDAPHLDVDPFAIEFFDDPFPTHERLREAGPLVYPDKGNVLGGARYPQVHCVLNDPQPVSPNAGRGFQLLAQETRSGPP